MKSIREFIAGKIRRSESEALLTLEHDSAGDAELGALEGTLAGPRGRISFYERGMLLADQSRVLYEDIERVVLEPVQDGGERCVDIVLKGDTTKRLHASAAGGEVVHATLRWIGSTQLRRKIAD